VKDSKAIQKALMAAKSIGDSLGLGKRDVLDRASGGEVDVRYDNPGGNWLKNQREDAEAVIKKHGNIGASGALTAWSKPVHVDPAKLSKIPGAMNERPEPGNPKYDDLYQSIKRGGFDNQKSGPVLVGINHRGEPHIIEGNNRAAVARDLGVKSVPAEFRWFAGGEQANGFKPEHIKSLMPDITKATGGYIHKAKGGHIHDHAKAVRQALMAAKDAPISESAKTLKTQQDMFLAGKRKAMLYTHQEPALPQGAARLVTQHGVFHYNPALIDKKAIEAAVANGRVNEILGLGPYSKTDVLYRVAKGEPLVGVIGRDAGGHEALSAVGTPSTAAEQAIAIGRQLPAGGNVGVEHPAKVLMERASSRGSEPQ